MLISKSNRKSRRLSRELSLAAAAALAVSASPSAQAATLFWDGGTVNINTNGDGLSGGTSGNWDNALTNWDQGSGLPHVAWSAGNTSVFAGTAGTVTLTDNISVGGLQFNTTAYTITGTANSKTLSFAAGNDTILLNAIAAATITGTVGGSGDVILTQANPSTAGTVTFNGTSTGGWSATTTINPGMTVALSASSQALGNTTGITLNGGGITLTNTTNTEGALDRVSNSAGITSNGGTITYTNTATGTLYAETLGALTLTTGQLNVVSTNAVTSGTETLTFGAGSLTHAATNTSAITFSGGSLGASTKNSIIVTSQSNTAANSIIGPWATFGTSAAAQTDYATFNITGGVTNAFGIQGAGIAASAESAWSTDYTALTGTLNNTLADAAGSAFNGRLTATRNVNSLRAINSTLALTSVASNTLTVSGSSFANGDAVQIGGTAPTGLANNTVYYVVNASGTTFQLAASPGGTSLAISGTVTSANIAGGITLSSGNNLGTYGILNGNGAFLPIGTGSTGGAVTLPTTAAGNLFINAGSAGIGINAPITDNTGALTLVKDGANGLWLTGANTYSGGTVLNAGTVAYTADSALGLSGTRNITFNGAATLSPSATSSLGTLTVNAGGVATINNGGGITFGSTTGSGFISATQVGSTNTINIGNASTFTGSLKVFTGGVNNLVTSVGLQFGALNDAAGSALQIQGGGSDSNQIETIALAGDAGQLTFNNRQVQILPRSTSNWGLYNVMLANNNTSTANTWVINTNLSNLSDRASQSGGTQEFTLRGTNTGNNVFNGVIGDGLGFTSITPTYLVKADAGRWSVSGANTFTGGVILNSGTLSVGTINSSSVAGPLGMGTVQLGGIDRVGAGHGFSNNSGILEYTGSGQTTNRAFLIGDTIAADNGAGSILNDGSGALIFSAANFNPTIASITATRTLTLGGTYSATANQVQGIIQDNVAGTGPVAVTKSGIGTWVLSGNNSYTGSTTVNAGTLQLNYANNTSVLSSSSPLILGGGTLQLLANSIGSTAQTLTNLSLTAGTNSSIVLNSNGGNATLTIGNTTVTTGAGANVNFNYYDGGNGTTNGASVGNDIIAWNPTLTNGIIGAAYTVTDAGGSGYATVSSGNVTRYTVSSPGSAGLPQTTGNASLNYFVDSSYGNSSTSAPGSLGEALTGNVAANTVTVDTTGGSGNLTLGNRTLTLTTLGGMLFTGNNSYTITATTGGGLKSSASGNSTVLNNYNSSTVTINAPILANGTSGLTVNGTGVTALGASGNFSGSTTINGGTLLANNSTGSATGSGNITVTAGTSNYGGAKFGGNGSVSGTVTLNGSNIATRGGLIAAGSSSSTVGTFTTGNQTWNGGAAYEWKITGDGTGVTGNQSTVADFLQIGNSTSGSPLSVSTTSLAAFTIAPLGNLTSVGAGPFSWDIAQVGSGNATTISLNGVATAGNATTPLFSGVNNANFALDTSGLAINGSPPSASSFALYFETVGSNNDLVLTYNGTPEPGTAILVLGGAVPMLMGRRRRKMGMKEQNTQA